MRARLLAIVTAFLCVASAAWGADRPDVKGLYLLADYPAVSVQPGTTANIPIKLQNYGVAPVIETLGHLGEERADLLDGAHAAKNQQTALRS